MSLTARKGFLWLSLLLAGCGGGGGGGGAPDTTSPTGPTTDTIADGPANAHLTFSELLPFSDSLIRGTERAVSSAFDVALNYENFNLQLSQPTYFETGI
ncbi:MAG: hypothetical protein ACR2OK_04555, partial [Parvibaculales bacterium]